MKFILCRGTRGNIYTRFPVYSCKIHHYIVSDVLVGGGDKVNETDTE